MATHESRISLCELAFPHTAFEQDVAIFSGVGARGIGLDERKLADGQDEASLRLLREHGLRPTICATNMLTVLPVDQTSPTRPEIGPRDPDARTEAFCAGIRRLAAFSPEVVFCCTGPAGELGSQRARSIVVEALRAAAATAAEVGVRLAIEPMRVNPVIAMTIITTLEEAADLIDEVGDDRIGIVYDTWHLWDSPHIYESSRALVERIAGVQVCDYRPPRSARDRLIPGEGIANLAALLRNLEESGYTGWYDLEIFSDELWKLDPEEFARRSVEGLRGILSTG